MNILVPVIFWTYILHFGSQLEVEWLGSRVVVCLLRVFKSREMWNIQIFKCLLNGVLLEHLPDMHTFIYIVYISSYLHCNDHKKSDFCVFES